MSFSKIEDNFNTLTDEVKEHINLRMDYLKLLLTEKFSKVISSIFMSVIFFILAMFLIFFLSFTFAFWFSEITGSLWLGTLIVMGIYLLIGVLLWTMRRKIFIDPLVRQLARVFLEEDEDEQK